MHPWLSRNENVSKNDVCMVDGGGVFLLFGLFFSSYYVQANNLT